MHFAAACFTGALITDIVYSQTMQMMWTNFSAWLLFAGAVMGAVAFLAGTIDAVRGQLALGNITGWLYGLCTLAVLAVAILNSFVHSRDAWTSVMPHGLILSAVTFLLMLVASVLGARVNRLVWGGF
ncbi:DUF2231 domain-containing protein [Rhizobium viscosum]